tara:strand:+ start:306 stop:467 length:162 start_codon:yes stop_codon:yes gene_type:complete
MKEKGAIEGSNHQLARKMDTTARQISKSRKRGWITTASGEQKTYTAPRGVINP